MICLVPLDEILFDDQHDDIVVLDFHDLKIFFEVELDEIGDKRVDLNLI
jgi:hypothetical protein